MNLTHYFVNFIDDPELFFFSIFLSRCASACKKSAVKALYYKTPKYLWVDFEQLFIQQE